MLKKWFSASKINKNTLAVAEHEKKLNLLDDKLTVVEDNLNEQNDFTKVMCNSMLALLNHNINGNSVDKLEKAKDELEDYLIKTK